MEKNQKKSSDSYVLIGFMGCGKTTIGIKLSYKLRTVVEDTDKLIENKYGMKISDIFSQKGESAFRDMETLMLQELAEKKKSCIYSVGGGTPIREENRKWLKQMGKVFFLRATADTIYDRLKDDTTRPLLQGDNPRGKIESLLAQRKEYYEDAADYIIDVDGKTLDDIVQEIMSKCV